MFWIRERWRHSQQFTRQPVFCPTVCFQSAGLLYFLSICFPFLCLLLTSLFFYCIFLQFTPDLLFPLSSLTSKHQNAPWTMVLLFLKESFNCSRHAFTDTVRQASVYRGTAESCFRSAPVWVCVSEEGRLLGFLLLNRACQSTPGDKDTGGAPAELWKSSIYVQCSRAHPSNSHMDWVACEKYCDAVCDGQRKSQAKEC